VRLPSRNGEPKRLTVIGVEYQPEAHGIDR